MGEFESFRDPESYAGGSIPAGAPKPDRSKCRSQIKRDTLALQVGGWAQGQHPQPGKIPVPLKMYNYGKMDG